MSKVGVLFSNLGTPQAPQASEVGDYLGEFLMDRHVIQLPWLFRWLLVKKIIVPFRSEKSAKNYKKVWTERGSPLLVETEKAAAALQKELGEAYKVVVGMRYGKPDFADAREQLKDCKKVILFAQYPQYAASTVETGLEHFNQYFSDMATEVIDPYFDHPAYIKNYAEFLKIKMKDLSFDHVLMSYHGLPESHVLATDRGGAHCLNSEDCCRQARGEILRTCYKAQCIQSADALAKAMGWSRDQYSVSFQSRLGRQKWIKPYTEQMYGDLIARGHKRLAVFCPGFSVDGLETLEEIAMEGKERFLEQGGEKFQFIPCLNDDKNWIQACAQILRER